jgi:lipopolysaccharide/colanic/teichoic acid biosynthesis glycosyltransferase
MSLVGPRPDVPEIVDEYTPSMRRILSVPPGMTSVASLALRREEELMAGCPDPDLAYRKVLVPFKVEMAMAHVQRHSLAFDLGVLAKTVWALTAGAVRRNPEPATVQDLKRRLAAFCADDARIVATDGQPQVGPRPVFGESS